MQDANTHRVNGEVRPKQRSWTNAPSFPQSRLDWRTVFELFTQLIQVALTAGHPEIAETLMFLKNRTLQQFKVSSFNRAMNKKAGL